MPIITKRITEKMSHIKEAHNSLDTETRYFVLNSCFSFYIFIYFEDWINYPIDYR
jgi:hypothetical protein